MAIVRMMQMARDQIVGMIAVRNGFVSAVGAVNVLIVVPGALVARRTIGRIGGVDGKRVLVVVIVVGTVEMAVVNVVDVAVVPDGGMPAIGAVLMDVIFVRVMSHGDLPRCGFVLARVRERVENKIEDVLVGETVENVFAVAAARDETLGAQNAQTLRDRRYLLALGVCNLCNTRFPLRQQRH